MFLWGVLGMSNPHWKKMKELGFWWQLKERTTPRGYVDNYRETSKSCLLFFLQKCAYRSCWDLLGMAPRCVKHVVYCVCIILAIVFVDVTMSEPGLSQSAVSCHDLPCSTTQLEISYNGDTRKSSIHRWIYMIGHAAAGVSPVSGNPSPSTG